MEIQFDREPPRKGKVTTRLYAPTHEGAEQEFGAPSERVAEQPMFETGTVALPRQKLRVKTSTKIVLLICAFILATMLIFILSGYERISRAYSDINALNSEIDEVELNIKALDVSIECAVTIADAQDAAERYGMQYPTESQYVRSGSSIPLSSAPAGTDPASPTTSPNP